MKLQPYEKLIRIRDLQPGDVFTHVNRRMKYLVEKKEENRMRLYNLTKKTRRRAFDEINKPFQMDGLVIKFQSL